MAEDHSAGQVPGLLPGYRAAGATWWIETVQTRPGWQEAIGARVRAADPAGGGPEVQSPRG